MNRENENIILMPINKPDYSLEHIRKIIGINEGKTIDLLHIAGVDSGESDYFPLEELSEIAAEIPAINNCYRCDVSELVESLRKTIDQKYLLADYQLRHIILILVWVLFIKKRRYAEVIYYSPYSDYRLNEIPAKTILHDPKCICLMNELERNSPGYLRVKRFFVSQTTSLIDYKPEFGYAMEEKDIIKLCRRAKRALKTLKFEEISIKNTDNF